MVDETNGTFVIRVSLDTYHKLNKLRNEKKTRNLQETGRVGDAGFDGIINDLLEKPIYKTCPEICNGIEEIFGHKVDSKKLEELIESSPLENNGGESI